MRDVLDLFDKFRECLWCFVKDTMRHKKIEDPEVNVYEILCQSKVGDFQAIEKIKDILLKMMEWEDNRTRAIDTKANHLFTYSVALFTILAHLFLSDSRVISENVKIGLYISIPTLFTFATVNYIVIFPHSRWRSISGEDMFNERALSIADVYDDGSGNSYTKPDSYIRYITTHFWEVYSANYKANESKGKLLKLSYWIFLAFFVETLIIILIKLGGL